MQAGVDGGGEQAGRPTRWAVAAVVALAVALHAPSLLWGFFADDYSQQLVLRGVTIGSMRPWSLYDFGQLDPAQLATFEQAGYPWWMGADWKVRFFRPLSSLTLWLDHVLFGDQAIGYHLSSLAWFALALVLVHALFRAIGLGPKRALLALLIFGVHSGSAVPVGWIANRNSLVALVLEVGAVLAVATSRRASSSPSRAALALAMALGLASALSKESGVAALALVALFLVWHARRPVARAALPLVLAAVYLIAYLACGFGARTPFYPTPWSDPARFAGNLALLLPGSVPSLCGLFSLDLAFLLDEQRPYLIVAALVLAGLIVAAAWPVLRRCDAAPLWLGWWLVTLLPQGSAPPSDRLLLTTAVASSALLAELVARALAKGAPHGRATRLAARFLLVASTAIAALSLLAAQEGTRLLAVQSRQAVLEADVGDPSLGRREVFLLQAPNALAALSPGATWAAEREDRDLRFWSLQQGRRGLRWRRIDARSFELVSLDRPFLDLPFESVLLSRPLAPRQGERWRRSAFEVAATEVDGHGLRTLRFTCQRDLDDARNRFLVWRQGRWVHVPPPAIGQELVLPPVEPLLPFLP
jgi:hypothetical protein